MVSLGLVGYPLGHSFSPAYFKEKFRENGVEGKYVLFPLRSIKELDALLDKNPELAGFNVTIPYKKDIISRLDHIEEAALAIGAVNTVKITEQDGNRQLIGYNTDWLGFAESLHKISPTEEFSKYSAVVLGTGGAAHAVGYALKQIGIPATFVSRSPEQSRLHPVIGYDDLTRDLLQGKVLVINTTPLGMYPNVRQCPPIDYNFLTDKNICYDLIYNPELTEFLKRAAGRGAKIMNGLEMLHSQADSAWKIWMSRNGS